MYTIIFKHPQHTHLNVESDCTTDFIRQYQEKNSLSGGMNSNSALSIMLMCLKGVDIPDKDLSDMCRLIPKDLYAFGVEFMSSQDWFSSKFHTFIRPDIEIFLDTVVPRFRKECTRTLSEGILLSVLKFNSALMPYLPREFHTRFKKLLTDKKFIESNHSAFHHQNTSMVMEAGWVDKSEFLDMLLAYGNTKIFSLVEREKLNLEINTSELKKIYKL